MTDRATLEALLARVLEGEGPDRELDAEITRAYFGLEVSFGRWALSHDRFQPLCIVRDAPMNSDLRARKEASGAEVLEYESGGKWWLYVPWCVPCYTTSLSAIASARLPAFSRAAIALTLVPEGRDWHVQSHPSVNACWASVSPAKHDLKLREWGSGMVKAVTPERALLAACIKARMEVQND